MSDYPQYERRIVSFNNGDVPDKTITICITPFDNEDKAIRTWISANGMGLIHSFKCIGSPTEDKT